MLVRTSSALIILCAVLLAADAFAPDAASADHSRASLLSTGKSNVITRNAVVGNPILVCSADFRNVTKKAISWWNDALGVTAFKWHSSTLTKCPINENEELGVGSVTIEKWPVGTRPKCVEDAGFDAPACWTMDREDPKDRYSGDWHTWYGRMQIVVSPDAFPRDFSASTPFCNAKAAFGTTGDMCHSTLALIAHELGHALSLADRYTKKLDSAGNVVQDANGNDVLECKVVAVMCNPYELDAPSQLDKESYAVAYYPRDVDDVQQSGISRNRDDFTISWNAKDIHVEQGVVVLRRPKAGTNACWHHITTIHASEDKTGKAHIYDGDKGKVKVKTPWDERWEYSVVAFTDALPADPSLWPTLYPDWDTGLNGARLCPGADDPLYPYALGLFEASNDDTDSVTDVIPGTRTGPPVIVDPPDPPASVWDPPQAGRHILKNSNTTLEMTFSWPGRSAADGHYLQWELHSSSSESGTYSLYSSKSDTTSPVTFSVSPGWYKLRGKVCQRDEDLVGGASGAQDPPDVTCGEWSSFAVAYRVRATTDPPDPARTFTVTGSGATQAAAEAAAQTAAEAKGYDSTTRTSISYSFASSGWTATATRSWAAGPYTETWSGTGGTRVAAWTDMALKTVGWTEDTRDGYSQIGTGSSCVEDPDAPNNADWTCSIWVRYQFSGTSTGTGSGTTQSAAESAASSAAQAAMPSHAARSTESVTSSESGTWTATATYSYSD